MITVVAGEAEEDNDLVEVMTMVAEVVVQIPGKQGIQDILEATVVIPEEVIEITTIKKTIFPLTRKGKI